MTTQTTTQEIREVLNDRIVLNTSQKINLSLKEIGKEIKQQLKKEYPLCDFSISKESYSMGCSLHINIMETDFKIIKSINEIDDFTIHSLGSSYTREDIKKRQEQSYFQLSHIISEVYNPNVWNNGVFLTEQGYKLVKRIIDLTNKFNYNNSDSQTDYYDVNFNLSLSIGKWNKPFKEGLK